MKLIAVGRTFSIRRRHGSMTTLTGLLHMAAVDITSTIPASVLQTVAFTLYDGFCLTYSFYLTTTTTTTTMTTTFSRSFPGHAE